jgi:hypothetical protein
MLESVVADIDLVILGHFHFYYIYLLNGNKLLAAKTCFIEYTVKTNDPDQLMMHPHAPGD